jgi:hypothetical protein
MRQPEAEVSMAINEVPHKSILTPTGGFLASGYGVRFRGMDKKGQPINSLLTCASARMAQCAAAAALGELGAQARFCIASLKDKALPRLLTEFKALSAIQQVAPAERACLST